MPKLNITEVENDPEVKLITDPNEWEYRCSSCDNFCDPYEGYSEWAVYKCPFEGKVLADTDYRKFNCKKYWS